MTEDDESYMNDGGHPSWGLLQSKPRKIRQQENNPAEQPGILSEV